MAADVRSGDEVAGGGGVHFREIDDALTRLAGGGLALLPPYGGAKREKRFATQSKATTKGVRGHPMLNVPQHSGARREGEKKAAGMSVQ